MPESAAGEMVVLNLDDQLWRQRLPLRRSLGAPAARPARRLTGEPGFFYQPLEFGGQLFFVPGGQSGAEALSATLSASIGRYGGRIGSVMCRASAPNVALNKQSYPA